MLDRSNETLNTKEQTDLKSGQDAWKRFFASISEKVRWFFWKENSNERVPTLSELKTKLKNTISQKASQLKFDWTTNTAELTEKFDKATNDILSNPKLPEQIKKQFLTQVSKIIDKISWIDLVEIDNLKTYRKTLSLWLEDKDNSTFFIKILEWYIDEIGHISSAIQQCYLDETIKIRWNEYHKKSYDEFIGKIAEIDSKYWVDTKSLFDRMLSNLDKDTVLSISFWNQFLSKQLDSYLIKATKWKYSQIKSEISDAFYKLHDQQIAWFNEQKTKLQRWNFDITEAIENKYWKNLEELWAEDLVILLTSTISYLFPYTSTGQDLHDLVWKYRFDGKELGADDRWFALLGLAWSVTTVWKLWHSALTLEKSAPFIKKLLSLITEGKSIWKILENTAIRNMLTKALELPWIWPLLKEHWIQQALENWKKINETSRQAQLAKSQKLTAAQLLERFEATKISKINNATWNTVRKIEELKWVLTTAESMQREMFQVLDQIKPWKSKDTINWYIKEFIATWDKHKLNELISHLKSMWRWADTKFQLTNWQIIEWRQLGEIINWNALNLIESFVAERQKAASIIWEINYQRKQAQHLLQEWLNIENWAIHFGRFITVFENADLVFKDSQQITNELIMLEDFIKFLRTNESRIASSPQRIKDYYKTWIESLVHNMEQVLLKPLVSRKVDSRKFLESRENLMNIYSKI